MTSILQVNVQDGRISVTLDNYQVVVPLEQVDSLINALQASKVMLGVKSISVSSTPVSETVSPPRAPYTTYEPAPRTDYGSIKKVSTGRQRSRKRVGDALREYMQQNPGWYTIGQLLKIAEENQMTDANPKRALMIALGKQSNIFESDGKSNWRLKEDATQVVEATKVEQPATTEVKRSPGRPRGRPPKKAAAVDSEGSPKSELLPPPKKRPYNKKSANKPTSEETIAFSLLSEPNFPEEDYSSDEGTLEEDTNGQTTSVVRRKSAERTENTGKGKRGRRPSADTSSTVKQRWDDSSQNARDQITQKLMVTPPKG